MARNQPKFTYTPSTSPWNQKVIYIIWGSQLSISLVTTLLGVGMLPSKTKEQFQDDGYSQIFYLLTVAISASMTILSTGFIILQYIWYRKHNLHPTWVLAISITLVILWMISSGWAIASLAGINYQFTVYEAVIMLCILPLIPFVAGLVYFSIVHRRYKSGMLVARDVEILDLDGTKK